MRAVDEFERRVRAELDKIDRAGLRRSLRAPSGIDLSSNDYLGLAAHPMLKQRMAAAVCEYGCGSTGSRLLRGERECFSQIEQRFAQFKGAERSLYFSSGYLANLAVLTAFPESGDVIFSDERNHASLIDGARLSRARRVIFPHNDAAALRRLMSEAPGEGQKFIVVESLFSMDGDFAPAGGICRVVPGNRRGADRRRSSRGRDLRGARAGLNGAEIGRPGACPTSCPSTRRARRWAWRGLSSRDPSGPSNYWPSARGRSFFPPLRRPPWPRLSTRAWT